MALLSNTVICLAFLLAISRGILAEASIIVQPTETFMINPTESLSLQPTEFPTGLPTASPTPQPVPLECLPPQLPFMFSEEVYSVVESDRRVEVCATALDNPAGHVLVSITVINTQKNTATRMDDFRIPPNRHILDFDNMHNPTQCGMIDIIDDEQPELTETFTIAVCAMMGTAGNLTGPLATAEVSIVDNDHLECAEDIYIILKTTAELTVCVVPVLVCVQSNCTDVAISVGKATTEISQIIVEDATENMSTSCTEFMFITPISPGQFDITLVKSDIFGNSSDNTETTCRVRVISPEQVPELMFQRQEYFVLEGKSLEMCGFLVDETGEFEPAETLIASFINSSGDIVKTITFKRMNASIEDPGVKYCGSVLIVPNNDQPERTRYFQVELSGPMLNAPGIQPTSGSSEVSVKDDDGLNVECGDITSLISEGQNCFEELAGSALLNALINCYFDRKTDCTYWQYSEYEFIAENPQTLQNFVPSLYPHSQLLELFQSLYPNAPTHECSTQCVAYTSSYALSCPESVLIMDEVFVPAALEFHGTKFFLSNNQSGQNISLDILCCTALNESSAPSTCTGPLSPFPREAIIGTAVGGTVVLVLGALVIILAALLCCSRHRGKYSIKKSAAVEDYEKETIAMENPSHRLMSEPELGDLEIHHWKMKNITDVYATWRKLFASVIIEPSQLKTQEVLGEGAFGQVHKGTLITSQGTASTQVAIKSIKESPSEKEITDFISESEIMLDFSHPNVIKLVGVCFDTEDGLPRIVLPYMENSDLKTFLKMKRLRDYGGTSIGSVDHFPQGLTTDVLVEMCLDIAKGMEYLSRSKFVHRDLAARNCMVDEKLRVCVADFGLSKDVYSSDYYRLTHAVPLPIKWMAPESLYDNVYNEKTDVWSFGVVCWEVFSLGRVPFPGVDNADIPDYISDGYRLKQPSLCPNEINDLMQSTWNVSPEKRPTFLQLAHSLANVLGEKGYSVLVEFKSVGAESDDVVTFSNQYTSQPDGATSSDSQLPEYATVQKSKDIPASSELHDKETEASSHVSEQTDPHTYHVLEQLHAL